MRARARRLKGRGGLCYIQGRRRLGTAGPDPCEKAAARAMLDDYLRQYGVISLFLAVAVAVPAGMLLMSWALSLLRIRPYNPSPVKKSIYECGFETLSGRWSQFNFRYYAIALDFVIFDVEVVFLFPWAAAFGLLSIQFGLSVLWAMLIFLGVLALGWIYAWRKGSLQWS